MPADVTINPSQLTPQQWDDELQRYPAAHFLQSSVWGAFKAAYGWRVDRLAVESGGNPVALASVLSRPMLRGLLRLAYVPRGPLPTVVGPAAFEAALAGLEAFARRPGCLVLKVEPELWDDDRTWARELLRRRGWTPGDKVQFRNTVTLPIDATEDAVLAAMKPKTRYNVRLAERRGVEVRPACAGDLGTMYDLYRETAVRDGFILRPRAYYESLWSGLRDAGMGETFLAWSEGRPLAGVVAVAYGRTAWYLHGASTDDARHLMPTYLLQWRAIQWARARGCAVYDMWGAPETEAEDDPMHGVLRFKLGFGGTFRQGIGAWDFAPRPLLYRAYTTVLPRLLAVTRAARRRSQRRE
ncbi:MAG: lipid II:glycine glycyltransferase FemX [Anaerolineae bacterium]